MIGGWKFTAMTLVLAAVLSGLGLGCAGLLSAPDWIAMSLGGGFCVSMLGACGLVVCYYVKLRRDLRTYLDRLPLSDEEFAALLSNDTPVDLGVVQAVRQMAARRFWSLGGECFYPGDRLEADLHLSDVAPWALEDFWYDLDDYLGAAETNRVDEEIITFGDVVLLANRRRKGRNSMA